MRTVANSHAPSPGLRPPFPRGLASLPECCTQIRAFFPKAARECRFKTKGDACQIPSWEGRKPKASGWVFMTENPPRPYAPPLHGERAWGEEAVRLPLKPSLSQGLRASIEGSLVFQSSDPDLNGSGRRRGGLLLCRLNSLEIICQLIFP